MTDTESSQPTMERAGMGKLKIDLNQEPPIDTVKAKRVEADLKAYQAISNAINRNPVENEDTQQ